jgi:hypothetical protein
MTGKTWNCEISGSHRCTDNVLSNICALLGFYIAWGGSFSPTFREIPPVSFSRVKMLEPGRLKRYVVPKLRKETAILHCTKSQNRTDFTYIAAEAWNHKRSSFFWVDTQRLIAIIYRSFGANCRSLPHVSSSPRSSTEMSVNNYEPALCNNPEDSWLQIRLSLTRLTWVQN